MVVLLIVNEVVDKEDVSKVNKTISLVGLQTLLVVPRSVLPLIHWQSEIIEMILMIFLKVLFNLVMRISAWNVLDHQVGSCFFAAENLVKIDWSTIVLTLV